MFVFILQSKLKKNDACSKQNGSETHCLDDSADLSGYKTHQLSARRVTSRKLHPQQTLLVGQTPGYRIWWQLPSSKHDVPEVKRGIVDCAQVGRLVWCVVAKRGFKPGQAGEISSRLDIHKGMLTGF